jgi:hypothetical protein
MIGSKTGKRLGLATSTSIGSLMSDSDPTAFGVALSVEAADHKRIFFLHVRKTLNRPDSGAVLFRLKIFFRSQAQALRASDSADKHRFNPDS